MDAVVGGHRDHDEHQHEGDHRPDTASGGGIGLWLARQLADVVTIHLGTAETTVELSFPMAGRP
jgi:hypothetical protein